MTAVGSATAVTAAAALGAVLPLLAGGAAYADGGAAATCGPDEVTVVVEPGDLPVTGGAACAAPGTAASALEGTGRQLTRHRQQRDFLCQLDGEPADGDCLRTDRYWSLYVAPAGEEWAYASLPVFSQPVAAGDSVALVWQSSPTRALPSTAPASPPPGETPIGAQPAQPQTQPPLDDTARGGSSTADGLPGWVPPAVLGALVVAGGAVAIARRRAR